MRQQTTASQYLTDQLTAWGIKRIYGVAGDAILPWLDQLGKQKEIEYIGCRHESAAAMMASAEAKLTGIPAVCTATSGPGIVNLLNGLADASIDRVPVIAITGQVATDKLGSHYKQFIPQQQLVATLARYSTEVVNPEAIVASLHRAFVSAIQHRGVAHLGICEDVFSKQLTTSIIPSLPSPKSEVRIDKMELELGLKQINQAKRPILLIGNGTRNSAAYVTTLAELLGAAIVLSLGAKGVVPENHPQVVGGVGEGGSKATLQALAEADLLVIIGATWFPRSFIPENLSIIQIDANLESFHPHSKLTPIMGKAEDILPAWINQLEKQPFSNNEWMGRVNQLHQQFWQETQLDHQHNESVRIKPEEVIRAVEQTVESDAVIAIDTGEHTIWFNRMFRANRQFPLFSGKWRTMGFALPAGIAAKLVKPDRQVVVLVGDGGLLMNSGELMTLKQRNLPITVIVFNNGSLGLEEAKMQWKGLRPFGTRIENPDFAQLARSFGLQGVKVEHREELTDTLRQALTSDQPTLIEVYCTMPTLQQRKSDLVLQTQALPRYN